MASSSVVVSEALLEDKIADIWPDYPCLYDARSRDFKNRDLRDKSMQEIAEKLGQTGMFILFTSSLFTFYILIVGVKTENYITLYLYGIEHCLCFVNQKLKLYIYI